MVTKHRFPSKLFFFLSMVETIIAFIALVRLPTDPKNNFFLGFSINRIILFLVMTALFSFFTIQLFSKKHQLFHQPFITNLKDWLYKVNWLYIVLLFFCWNVIFLPANRFGKYEVLYSRIQPLLLLISAIIFTFLLLLRIKNNRIENELHSLIHKKTILVVGIVIIITWIFLATTRIGLDIDHFFWGGAATPILPIVVNVSLLIPILILSNNSKYEFTSSSDNKFFKFIPIILFFSAVIIWNLEPFSPNFFAPQIRPPNYEYYPYSDAQIYDMTAQSLLNGEGYLNRGYVQRPLYGFILFLIHSLVGQKYLNVIFIQTILYALFPVLLYYLGKKLLSPYIGISLGILAILRELTAFQASKYMELVHSKLYMTDIWAGFFALLITLLFSVWYLGKKENHLLLILIGAVSGISLLIRINLLFVFIPMFLFLFFTEKTKLKLRFYRISILGASIVIVLLPWMFRNLYQVGEFGIEPQKFRMVIDTRFDINSSNEDQSSSQPKLDQMVVPELRNQNSLEIGITISEIQNILRFTTANFLHNEIHSILIFPNSLFSESVKSVVENNSYIQETWTGEMDVRQITAVVINLIFIGLGISLVLKKLGFFGLFPLTIHLFYNLSNGIARVSGWRYVLVTDWVVILYYVVGLLFLASLLLSKSGILKIDLQAILSEKNEDEKSYSPQGKKYIFSGIILVVIMSIGMVLPEMFIQKKYEGEISRAAFIQQLESDDAKNKDKIIKKIPDDTDLVFIHTKAFYPRYYDAGKGEPGGNIEWLLPKDYNNLGFMIMNPIMTGVTIKIENSPSFFPHNSEVYIIGSWVNSEYNSKYLIGELIYLPDLDFLISTNGFLQN